MTNMAWPKSRKNQSARRNDSVHNLQTISPLRYPKNRTGNIESFDPSCSRNVYVEIAGGSVCSRPLNFDSIVEVEQGNFIFTEQWDNWLRRTSKGIRRFYFDDRDTYVRTVRANVRSFIRWVLERRYFT